MVIETKEKSFCWLTVVARQVASTHATDVQTSSEAAQNVVR